VLVRDVLLLLLLLQQLLLYGIVQGRRGHGDICLAVAVEGRHRFPLRVFLV
jgi:hypothetical protein